MKNRRNILKRLERIESAFFDIDEAGKIAKMRLRFQSPSGVFDETQLSKIPIFQADFDGCLKSAFETIPSRYRIRLEVIFDDPEGYTADQLRDIFWKNMLLRAMSLAQSFRSRNRVAISLIAAGLVCFVAMMLIGNLWEAGSFWHEVFFYALDIMTTVLFWEAAGILLVENREQFKASRSYVERFESIHFIGPDGQSL